MRVHVPPLPADSGQGIHRRSGTDGRAHDDRRRVVHLDFLRPAVRARQVEQMVQVLSRRRRPVVVMGDFNSDWRESSAVQRLAAALGLVAHAPEARSSTFPTFGARLDWILVSSDSRSSGTRCCRTSSRIICRSLRTSACFRERLARRLASRSSSGTMRLVPRTRWLALLFTALLVVLGGANRGRVPAHEREGSRTADEPAALTMRWSALDAARSLEEPRPSLLADVDPRWALRDANAGARHIADLLAFERAAVPRSQHSCVSASPRGPPLFASMV